MTDLVAARSQMALSLGFHIIFAVIGMVMPFLMVGSHWLWLKKKRKVYLDLTQAWSKGVAVFFAVGAVSGTLLSFELGILWPSYMEISGPVIGIAFTLEAVAFFLEAIAIGLFLYGWNRLKPWWHWACGLMVGVCGLFSGTLVLAANSWMNSPTGFTWKNGVLSDVDPWKAMFNAAWFDQSLHMTLAAFVATCFAVAGLHAMLLLRDAGNTLHRKAIKIALVLAILPTLLQPISGDLSAKGVAQRQPVKLAAMEAHFETQRGAPLIVGGIVDSEKGEVRYALKLPKLLSFLAYGNFDAEVKGLNDFPREIRPPVGVVHTAFQIMVACGTILAGVALLALLFLAVPRWRKFLYARRFLALLALASPLGMIALEAGWTVTEVGRQPWIIYEVLRTREALTPVTGLVFHFVLFTGIYLALTLLLVGVMLRQFRTVKGYRDDV